MDSTKIYQAVFIRCLMKIVKQLFIQLRIHLLFWIVMVKPKNFYRGIRMKFQQWQCQMISDG